MKRHGMFYQIDQLIWNVKTEIVRRKQIHDLKSASSPEELEQIKHGQKIGKLIRRRIL